MPAFSFADGLPWVVVGWVALAAIKDAARATLPAAVQARLRSHLKPLLPAVTVYDILSAEERQKNRRPLPGWKYFINLVFATFSTTLWLFRLAYVSTVTRQFSILYLAHAITWLYLAARALKLRTSPTPHYAALGASVLELVTTAWFYADQGIFDAPFDLPLAVFTIGLVLVALSQPVEEYVITPNIAEIKLEHVNDRYTYPEDGCTLWQTLSFSWVRPLLLLGSQKTLKPADIWSLSPFLDAQLVHQNFDYKPTQNLIWALCKFNGMDILLDGLLQIVANVLKMAPSLFTKVILEAIGSSDRAERLGALKYAFLALLLGVATSLMDVTHSYYAERAILRMRAQLLTHIHHKALLRKDMQGAVDAIQHNAVEKKAERSKEKRAKPKDDSELGDATVGRVVNLMSSDAAQIASACTWFLLCLEIPIRFTVALFFLYKIMGYASLFGLLVLAVTIPTNHFLVKRSKNSRKAWKDAQDERVNEVNTLIRSIRFIKGNDWQGKWTERVLKLRKKELRLLNVTRFESLVLGLVWIMSPGIVVVVSFWSYSAIFHKEISIPLAFTAIGLFNQLSGPLSMVPTVVIYLLQATVSAKRISSFLAEQEVDSRACSFLRDGKPASDEDLKRVSIRGTFKWVKHTLGKQPNALKTIEPDVPLDEDFVLSIPDKITFPEGLTLITGSTGSGKSSLMSALLGEMDQIEGKVELEKNLGNVAYMASVPFLEGATVRQNILFSEEYIEERYNATLEACALRPDLELWDLGDQTTIGERGISLSGGQRARIALAKVVYAHSKVVLLDDVLAAVDTHTARHLVRFCFGGHLMAGRVVILATHHLDICKASSKLVLTLEEGLVVDQEVLDPVVEIAQVPATPYTPPAVKKQVSGASLDEEEEVAEGSVKLRVFADYLRAIDWRVWLALFLFQLAARIFSFGEDWLLKTWGELTQKTADLLALVSNYLTASLYMTPSATTQSLSFSFSFPWPGPEEGASPWLRLYMLFYTASSLLSVGSTAVVYVGASFAAQRLFRRLLYSIVNATMRWHDKTPVGRILNRFGDDFNKIDGSVAMSFRYILSLGLSIIVSAGIISVILPPFLVPFLALLALVWVASRPYVATSVRLSLLIAFQLPNFYQRSLRRIDSNSRSPIYTGFGEVLHGIATIRAFAAEHRYEAKFFSKVNAMLKLSWAYCMIRRWLRLRFDLLATIINSLTFALVIASNVPQGLAAIAIVWSQYMVSNCLELVQMATMLEQDLNSVERVDSYINLKEQEPPNIIEGRRPPLSWPSSDAGIIVKDLHVRYHESLPDVLKGLSFNLRPREKVALVGRTGSGKSTFSLALLRFIEARQGSIVIDGVDISTIGLSDLRKNIVCGLYSTGEVLTSAKAVMSQDAVLFKGTLRENLDPFDEFDDSDLWDVLGRCQMTGSLPSTRIHSRVASRVASAADLLTLDEDGTATPDTLVERKQQIKSLDHPVSEMGNNFSSGQRQLLALARCLLRRPKILLMDEASSSIDKSTDNLIQQFIREAFSDALVITIAHRLATVIQVDRVLVLDKGTIAQFASPKDLLASKEGLFYHLCCESADKAHLFSAVGEPVPE